MVFTMDLTPEGISFGRHSTGFSLAVDNFCRDLSSILKKKVYVSCSSLQNPEIVVASTYTLLRRDMKTILKHCRLQDALRAVSWFFLAKKLSLKQRIQIIKQQISIGVSDNCIFYGSVSREESLRIISNSDLVASTTLSEGFGLPFLEGYSFGIPALFFKDIAAAEILSDSQCCITIEGHKE